jgi:hypothetical protein
MLCPLAEPLEHQPGTVIIGNQRSKSPGGERENEKYVKWHQIFLFNE